MSAITVHPAVDDDMPYVDHLQRKNAEELSFYPLSLLQREAGNGRVVLARVNGDPAGYLYHGALGHRVRIHQACIQYDLRGYLYGAALVRWLVDVATAAGSAEVSLRCGSDIAANGFWEAMGFQCVAVTPGGARRMRDINNWRLELGAGLFALPKLQPSERRQDASGWASARRRGISLGSQFLRGGAIAAYRDLIEGAADERP